MDRLSIGLLEIYLNRNSLTLIQLSAIINVDYTTLIDPVIYLREKGYLRIELSHSTINNLTDDSLISFDTPLEITIKGKAALEHEHKLSKDKRKEWIRYLNTIYIAISESINTFFFL